MNNIMLNRKFLLIILSVLYSSTIFGRIVAAEDEDVKGNVIWCDPNGSYETDEQADGSEEHPYFDVQRAIKQAKAGDRIWMRAGTYMYNKRIEIDEKYGNEEYKFELWGYGGQAIMNFSEMPYHDHSDNPQQGMRLTSSYWHLKNLDFCYASDNGLLIERFRYDTGPLKNTTTKEQIMAAVNDAHHNVIEQCNFYCNNDAGVQIKNLGADNMFINCDSYYNADTNYPEGQAKYGDADGFAPKISCGSGNYFFGCRAWHNSDDGWDSYYKSSNGFPDNIVVILENCLTYANGLDENYEWYGGGANGNGFKTGSKEGVTHYYMTRCAAFKNLARGFDPNGNNGDIIMINCSGAENGAFGGGTEHINCLNITGQNKWDQNLAEASYDQFVNSTDHVELIGKRNEDGGLPYTTYMRPKQDSWLVDAGRIVDRRINVRGRGYDIPEILYNGNAPDLGAYETGVDVNTKVKLVSVEKEDSGISVFQSADGILFLSLQGADPRGKYHANLYDISGKLLGQRDFDSTTAAIHLPSSAKGMVVLKVEGSGGFKSSIKAVLK